MSTAIPPSTCSRRTNRGLFRAARRQRPRDCESRRGSCRDTASIGPRAAAEDFCYRAVRRARLRGGRHRATHPALAPSPPPGRRSLVDRNTTRALKKDWWRHELRARDTATSPLEGEGGRTGGRVRGSHRNAARNTTRALKKNWWRHELPLVRLSRHAFDVFPGKSKGLQSGTDGIWVDISDNMASHEDDDRAVRLSARRPSTIG
jgi:hypothetical protein